MSRDRRVSWEGRASSFNTRTLDDILAWSIKGFFCTPLAKNGVLVSQRVQDNLAVSFKCPCFRSQGRQVWWRACSPSYSGGWGRRIAWAQEFWAVMHYADRGSTLSLASIWWPPRSGGPPGCLRTDELARFRNGAGQISGSTCTLSKPWF